jgi:outer membrane protein assembly factor BamA
MIALLLAVSLVAQAGERITEIRVHGNHTTPDADIIAMSGLVVGQPFVETTAAESESRLRATDRFADVAVQRRFLSIADPSQILVMIVVDERAAVTEGDLTPGPMRRVRAAGMWMPILSYVDGYGFTYGARIAFIEPLGRKSRVSVPLTWGGERRVGAELERTFERGPFSVARGSASASRRVNPYFDVEDERLELRVRGERALTSWLRTGGGGRTARVSFGGGADRHDAIRADIALDTRIDPSFPRNAIYASLAIEQLRFGQATRHRAERTIADLRGSVGVVGSSVAVVRVYVQTSNTALPASEQPMLGGSDTLRGYRGGAFAGDNLAVLSSEIRIPVNSPLSLGRFGVKGFVDVGTTWNAGQRLRRQTFERGFGSGIYFGGGPVIADIAVARSRQGRYRFHFGLGLNL